MEGRQSGMSERGGGPGANFQAPTNQDPACTSQPLNMAGQSWNSSNNGSPSSSGGVPSYSPFASPSAGAPARANGESVQGTSANGAPVPDVYHPSATAQFVYSAPIVVLAPAAMAQLFGGSAALYGGTTGFASGYVSGLATGQSPKDALTQGLINALFSGASLFGSSALGKAFGTMFASGTNQLITNGDVQWGIIFSSGAMRFGFGVGTGWYSPDSLGAAWATGTATGFFSGSLKIQGSW